MLFVGQLSVQVLECMDTLFFLIYLLLSLDGCCVLLCSPHEQTIIPINRQKGAQESLLIDSDAATDKITNK